MLKSCFIDISHATTTLKVHRFCIYALLSVRTQLLKTFSKALGRGGLYCNRRSFLNLRCTLKTASFEGTFAGHIAISLYSCCSACVVFMSAISPNVGRIRYSKVLQISFLLSTNTNDYCSLPRIVLKKNLQCRHMSCSVLPQILRLNRFYIIVK